ncbi:hypothetical protein WJX72_011091 [[Myrmecia] bisecta]|uniref:Rieske domain-containing protein n=1 Tax=[Myrmecia] bisecta TaxID=41462 RepID=A0AAW1QGW2_9CHLO
MAYRTPADVSCSRSFNLSARTARLAQNPRTCRLLAGAGSNHGASAVADKVDEERRSSHSTAESSHTATRPRFHDHETDTDPSKEGGDFCWTKHWYPLVPEDYLSTTKPNPLTLLGREFVVWKDSHGEWGALADQCPHRLAPLSDGKIVDGNLACGYHGWEFQADGKCINIPSASPGGGAKSPSQSSRACASAFPVQVKQGLLWIWPESGADAWLEASAEPPVTFPEMEDPSWAGSAGDYGFQENPAGWAVMTENAMDPFHALFVHDGTISKADDAVSMPMSITGDVDAQQGFRVAHDGYTTKQKKDGLKALREFHPPCTIRTEYTYASGMKVVTCLYLVPIKPGTTRTMIKFATSGLPGAANKLFKLAGVLPKGLTHAFGHGLVDQDMRVLHKQERRLAAAPRGFRDYYLPTQADSGVTAFWRWLQKAGGDVGWANQASSFDLAPQATHAQLLDHYARHTQYCSHCQKTIKGIDQARSALLAGSLLLAAWVSLIKGV